MSQKNINLLKLNFKLSIEQYGINITSIMKQFEQLMSQARDISQENTRLKEKVIILESNCNCPVQKISHPDTKKGR